MKKRLFVAGLPTLLRQTNQKQVACARIEQHEKQFKRKLGLVCVCRETVFASSEFEGNVRLKIQPEIPQHIK